MDTVKRYKDIILILSLIIITFLTFKPALKNGFVNFDDDINIGSNSSLSTYNAIKKIWLENRSFGFYPLTKTIFVIQSKLFLRRKNPAFGFHLTSIVFHIINVMLLYYLLQMLTKGKILFSFFTSLFFSLHPWKVETVAWITEQKTLLATVFLLLSTICFLKHKSVSEKNYYYPLSILCFTCSLLAKYLGAFMPFLFLLLTFKQNQKTAKRQLLQTLPFFIISIYIGSLVILQESLFKYQKIQILEKIILISHNYLHYFIKFLTPSKSLLFYYKHNLNPFQLKNWLAVILFATITAIAAIYFLKKKNSLSFIYLASIIFLLPLSGLFSTAYFTHSYVADRYFYLPSVFYLAIILSILKKKLTFTTKITLIIFLIITGFISGKTSSKLIQKWYNSISLWQYEIKNSNAQNLETPFLNLGLSFLRQNQIDKAKYSFMKSLTYNPENAKSLTNLGFIYQNNKLFSQAIPLYQQAIQINPDLSQASLNLANIYTMQKKSKQAINLYQKIVTKNLPQNHLRIAKLNYTIELLKTNQISKAKAIIESVSDLTTSEKNEINFYLKQK